MHYSYFSFLCLIYIFEVRIVNIVIDTNMHLWFDYSDIRIDQSKKREPTGQKNEDDLWREFGKKIPCKMTYS